MNLRPFNRSRALVVCIEGFDGAGKNTQACLLANRFLENGQKAKVVSVPVPEGAYYASIYKMLQDGRAKTHPELFQALQVSNRVDAQARFFTPYLNELDCLVLDRWHTSTYAYGLAMGSDEAWIDTLSEPLIVPDLTVVINGPCHRNQARDVYESDTPFQARVKECYMKWAAKTPTAVVVDGGQPVKDVAAEIWRHVEKSFK